MGSGDPRQEQKDDDLDDDVDLPMPLLPPDGGWGWMVVAASFVANFIVDGVCFSYGVFFPEYLAHFDESTTKTAFVGALIPAMYLGMGPIASGLANRYGFRVVTIVGAIIAAVSYFLSIFSPNMNYMIVIYGICGGFGFGMMYLPAILIVNFYFDKKRALATGIAVSGTGIGTMVFAPLGRYLLDTYQWKQSHIIISAFILNGIVCGAVFRPLEQNRLKKREKIPSDDPRIPPNIIMQKILDEKNRQRTISTGSLDGTYITVDNKLIKDPRILKKMYLDYMEQEHARRSFSKSTLSVPMDIPNGTTGNGVAGSPLAGSPSASSFNGSPSHEVDMQIKLGSAPSSSSVQLPGLPPLNKKLERLRAESQANSLKQPRHRGVSECSNSSQVSQVWKLPDGTISSQVSLRAASSLRSLKKEVNRPMYRKDIFYSGSVRNLSGFQSTSDMGTYVASITSIPDLPVDDDDPATEKCCGRFGPLVSVLSTMFDLSLFQSVTFVVLCSCNILAMIGFFTPFVYISQFAESKNISTADAVFLITFLGIFNTAGRILAGWLSDRPWADCLLIHNLSLVIGGLATCLVPFLNDYWMLCAYCAVFGSCIAAFICLRSIVLVELLGIEKLTNSFGLLLLCQGISSLIGSPLAGLIYDYSESYTLSFMSSGACIFLAGCMVLPIRKVRNWEKRRSYLSQNAESMTDTAHLSQNMQGVQAESNILEMGYQVIIA